MKTIKPLILLIILVASLSMMLTYSIAKINAESKLKTTLQTQLLQIVNELTITLERHSYLPSLLTNDKEISQFLITPIYNPKYKEKQNNINLSLEQTNNISGTATIFIMDAKGVVVSSSNWAEKESYINHDFSAWPYFEQASQNILGRYFSYQTEDNERYYYFARSIQFANKIIGIVVTQVPVSDIAFNWVAENNFAITDNNGVVFLSSNRLWDLNTISKFNLDLLDTHQRYSNNRLLPLNEESIDINYQGFQRITLLDTDYQMLSQRMELADWNVRMLSEYSIAEKEISRNIFIGGVVIFLIAAMAGLILRTQNQRQEFRQRARANLENKVKERTQALKKTQEDLIQAAKMAALGQLSAGITHEINNPLSAIRAYSDNAKQFLKKDRFDMVESNLQEITKLTENMAIITGQLKSFSRKSKGELLSVDIHDAIKNAISIVHSKIISTGTTINYHNDDKANTITKKQRVLADEVWLSQILVNLISNAISATNQNSDRNIWINVNEVIMNTKPHFSIEVKDNGTGIEDQNLTRIFEPFFTTKSTKKGLGLGLSISFNLAKDMNGSLDARNHKSGGALFTLCLPASTTTQLTSK